MWKKSTAKALDYNKEQRIACLSIVRMLLLAASAGVVIIVLTDNTAEYCKAYCFRR